MKIKVAVNMTKLMRELPSFALDQIKLEEKQNRKLIKQFKFWMWIWKIANKKLKAIDSKLGKNTTGGCYYRITNDED